ncbi:MAG: FAD-dependent oxidoreductase [Proteobacteria bacterium]|nr:FAD-dependent oxidoreductase [Pseudomonadota bacterium]
MTPSLPRQARAIIIGGGVIGCSVAYHLTRLGWQDVVLLERKRLTSGTTWHAAGLIAHLRATLNMTLLAKYSGELYERLEAETELSTGFRRNGAITLALTPARFEELRRQASMAKPFGIEVEPISASEVRQRYPMVETRDVVGALWMPQDGQADPSNIALALAKGARQRGARIFENVAVTGITTEKGRVTGVETEAGSIAADVVVNCAGLWSRQVGALAGVPVPLQACEHFYVVTEPVEGLMRHAPVLRVPDECAYFKEDAGKLLVGFFEPKAKPWAVEGPPADFEFGTLPDDWEHIAPELDKAIARVPALGKTGIRTFFNGPESFTPDDRYLLGESPALRGFFVAAGFNSVGIQSAGGAGKALAEWIDAGEPTLDLTDVDVRRMFPFQSTTTYLVRRVEETLGLLYADHWPHRQYASARGARRTPFHHALVAAGGCFGEGAGYERPLFYAATEEVRARPLTFGWDRQPWFADVAREHGAIRSSVGAIDMSPFGKIKVVGRDALDVLQHVCANDVDVPVGRLVYTQWLNRRGGIEADLTVARLAEDEFLVVTAAAAVVRDFAWLKRHIPGDAHCAAIDVSVAEACLAVSGPRSRELLAPVVGVDLSNASFPFGTVRAAEVGMAPVRLHRVSFVGELGWEIYVPSDMAHEVFGIVSERLAAVGGSLAGTLAMNSCRMEKAYRDFGHDVAGDDHVLEAGLGFAVRIGKKDGRFGPFIGRDAVLRKKEEGLTRRMLQFRVEDPEPLLYHNEPILRDGAVAGYITSGAYGHALGAAIGLGYVACRPDETVQDILGSAYELEIAGTRFAARASLTPFYDPRSERLRS